MKYANNLIHIKDLLVYDMPLIMHLIDVRRITLTSGEVQGDFFDGSLEAFRDCFFDNVGGETIAEFCEKENLKYEIFGEHFIALWNDLKQIDGKGEQVDHWLVCRVEERTVAPLMSDDYKTAITARELIETAKAVYLTTNWPGSIEEPIGEPVTDLMAIESSLPRKNVSFISQTAFEQFTNDNPQYRHHI